MMGKGSNMLRGLFPELPVAVVVGREEAFPSDTLRCVVFVQPAARFVVAVVSVDIESSFHVLASS
jgi:hypothetical protein